jgi:hypothetical protein
MSEIPVNKLLTIRERKHILNTRHKTNRQIGYMERWVIRKSVDMLANAGSEDTKMILASINDILGLYGK